MSMRLFGRAKRALNSMLDLPQDVSLDLPRITMIGRIHIYIENHRGVLTFSDTEFRLQLKEGQLRVLGRDFVLKMMLSDEVLLQGEIDEVIYVEAEKNT